jgi:hypothetical protein
MFIKHADANGRYVQIHLEQVAYVLWPARDESQAGLDVLIHFSGLSEPLRLSGMTKEAAIDLEDAFRLHGVE